MAQLYCEKGKHLWVKEGRGRPPKNCPDHRPVEQIKVTTNSEAHKPRTVFDLVPGLKEVLEAEKPTTRILHCKIGGHDWEAPIQRGRAPTNCPDHAQIGAVVRQVELTAEQRDKKREELRESIQTHNERIALAVAVDDNAFQAYMENKGNDLYFKNWLKVNSRLLGEVTAMTMLKKKLESI